MRQIEKEIHSIHSVEKNREGDGTPREGGEMFFSLLFRALPLPRFII